MKNKRFSSVLESVGRPSFAWNRLLLVAIVAGLIGACTTTKSDSVGDVDEAFARASYDKERE